MPWQNLLKAVRDKCREIEELNARILAENSERLMAFYVDQGTDTGADAVQQYGAISRNLGRVRGSSEAIMQIASTLANWEAGRSRERIAVRRARTVTRLVERRRFESGGISHA